MTKAGHVRMALPCSDEGIQELGVRPGDWVWLSDTEVVVGAKLAVDDRYELVAIPDWETVAHLDYGSRPKLEPNQAQTQRAAQPRAPFHRTQAANSRTTHSARVRRAGRYFE